MHSRELKKKIRDLLTSNDFDATLKAIDHLPEMPAVNALFSLFFNNNELIKWRAITAMGIVVSRLAGYDLNGARVVMRRLMWSLNDESGGIGWGSPEAMGEIMARQSRLADEYHRILISYIRPDGNFIEHEILQQGVIWGIGRLAQERAALLTDAAPLLIPYIQSTVSAIRGLAAWAARAIDAQVTKPLLQMLSDDNEIINFYYNGSFTPCTVGELANCTAGIFGGSNATLDSDKPVKK
jgi:hypothetical protein